MSNSSLEPVWVGMGANLGDPRQTFRSALKHLDDLDHCEVRAYSRFYRTKPLDSQFVQDDYLNAVALLATRLPAHRLMDLMLNIENIHGRHRRDQATINAPRRLDLDMLMYNRTKVCDRKLELPHPNMHQRGFVLVPMMDIDPDWRLLNGETVTEAAAKLVDIGVVGFYNRDGRYRAYQPDRHHPSGVHTPRWKDRPV